eukprot:GHVS01019495.1.p1 GENE.GHVS01019495.1~~GHVS01019495.1.p1  ORF type:complete len:2586 (-),score=324.89 GHVS01019495.1:2483-10240(-)
MNSQPTSPMQYPLECASSSQELAPLILQVLLEGGAQSSTVDQHTCQRLSKVLSQNNAEAPPGEQSHTVSGPLLHLTERIAGFHREICTSTEKARGSDDDKPLDSPSFPVAHPTYAQLYLGSVNEAIEEDPTPSSLHTLLQLSPLSRSSFDDHTISDLLSYLLNKAHAVRRLMPLSGDPSGEVPTSWQASLEALQAAYDRRSGGLGSAAVNLLMLLALREGSLGLLLRLISVLWLAEKKRGASQVDHASIHLRWTLPAASYSALADFELLALQYPLALSLCSASKCSVASTRIQHFKSNAIPPVGSCAFQLVVDLPPYDAGSLNSLQRKCRITVGAAEDSVSSDACCLGRTCELVSIEVDCDIVRLSIWTLTAGTAPTRQLFSKSTFHITGMDRLNFDILFQQPSPASGVSTGTVSIYCNGTRYCAAKPVLSFPPDFASFGQCLVVQAVVTTSVNVNLCQRPTWSASFFDELQRRQFLSSCHQSSNVSIPDLLSRCVTCLYKFYTRSSLPSPSIPLILRSTFDLDLPAAVPLLELIVQSLEGLKATDVADSLFQVVESAYNLLSILSIVLRDTNHLPSSTPSKWAPRLISCVLLLLKGHPEEFGDSREIRVTALFWLLHKGAMKLLTDASAYALHFLISQAGISQIWEFLELIAYTRPSESAAAAELLSTLEAKGVISIAVRRLLNCSSLSTAYGADTRGRTGVWSLLSMVMRRVDRDLHAPQALCFPLDIDLLAVRGWSFGQLVDVVAASLCKGQVAAAGVASTLAGSIVRQLAQSCMVKIGSLMDSPRTLEIGLFTATEEITSIPTNNGEASRESHLDFNLAVLDRLFRLIVPSAHDALSLNKPIGDTTLLQEAVLPSFSYMTVLTKRVCSRDETNKQGESQTMKRMKASILRFLLRIWPITLRLTLKGLLFLRQLTDPPTTSLAPVVEVCHGLVLLAGEFLLWLAEVPAVLADISHKTGERSHLPPLLVSGARYLPAHDDHILKSVESALRPLAVMMLDCSSGENAHPVRFPNAPPPLLDFLSSAANSATHFPSESSSPSLVLRHDTRAPTQALGPTSHVLDILDGDHAALRSLGRIWKPFHASTAEVQRGVMAVVLHLLDFDPKRHSAHKNQMDAPTLSRRTLSSCSITDGGDRKLRLACQLAHKSSVNFLASLQKSSDQSGTGVPPAERRQRLLDDVMERCRWVITNYPRGLCALAPEGVTTAVVGGGVLQVRSLSCTDSFGDALAKGPTVGSSTHTPPTSVLPCCPTNTQSRGSVVLRRSVTRNLGLLKRMLSHRRLTFDKHALWSRTVTNPDAEVEYVEAASHRAESGEVRGVAEAGKMCPADREGEELSAFVEFVLEGRDIEAVESDLRVEQLSAVCRYITLRSLKTLFLVGVSAVAFDQQSKHCGEGREGRKGFQCSRRRVASAKRCATDEALNAVRRDGGRSAVAHNDRQVGQQRISSDALILDQSNSSWRKPLLLDLLLPFNERIGQGNSSSVVCLRQPGWMLLKVFRSLSITLRSIGPVSLQPVSLTKRSRESGNPICARGFWHQQPLRGVLDCALSDMLRLAAEWHLQKNMRLSESLAKNEEDESWVSGSLEALSLHISFGTAPLNKESFITPLLRHLLVLSSQLLHPHAAAPARLRSRCWELFQAALWSVLVMGGRRERQQKCDRLEDNTTAVMRRSRGPLPYKTMSGEIEDTTDDSNEMEIKESAINIVMSALIELTDRASSGNPAYTPAQMESAERLTASLLNLLHSCVRSSIPTAVLILKSLMTARDLQPSNLEQMFQFPVVKSALYRLVTDCVRKAQNQDSYLPRRLHPGCSDKIPRRLNSNLLLQCLPPIVPLPTAGVVEAADIYMKPSDDTAPPPPPPAASPARPATFDARASGILSFTEELPAEGSNTSSPTALPPVPTPPRTNPFDGLPQSAVYLCASPTADFEATADGGTVQVVRTQNLGGVVLCRVPLTFPALNITDGQATDIISFRLPNAGRFGVTVAPADCILRTTTEVFSRNDVVGFKTSSCPDFWQNVFAAECEYQAGDVLDVKFNVEAQPSGDQQCLRTELMVSGVSIGSVLEVYFENRTQVDQLERMNLVFVFQDPITIIYDGPSFALDFVDANRETAEEVVEAEVETVEQVDAWKQNQSCFTDAVELYQAIVMSDNVMLTSLKDDVIGELCSCFTTLAKALSRPPFAPGEGPVESCRLTGTVWGEGEGGCSQEAVLVCKQAVAALAILCCDVHHEGELKNVLRTEKAAGRGRHENSQQSRYQGLPWLVGLSDLKKSAFYGLSTLQCEQLLHALVEVLDVPVVADVLCQIACQGPLPKAQGEEEMSAALVVAVASKAVLASCLLTRTLLHLHPQGLARPAQNLTRLFAVLQRVCFCAAEGRQDSATVSDESTSQADSCGAEEGSDSGCSTGCESPWEKYDCHKPKDANIGGIAALCGIPEDILAQHDCPAVAPQQVVPVKDTTVIWEWLRKIVRTWNSRPDSLPSPIRQVHPTMGRDRAKTRVFSYEGFSVANSRRLASRMKDSWATWSLKKDVIDAVCALAALVPDIFVTQLCSSPEPSAPKTVVDPSLEVLRLFRICVYFISRERLGRDRMVAY